MFIQNNASQNSNVSHQIHHQKWSTFHNSVVQVKKNSGSCPNTRTHTHMHARAHAHMHTHKLCLVPQRAGVNLSQLWAAHPAIRHLCDHYVQFYISYIYSQGLTPSYARHLTEAPVTSYKPPRSGTYVWILPVVVVWRGKGRRNWGKGEWGRRSNVNQSKSVINMTKTRPAEGFPARSGAAAVVCQHVSSPSSLLVASSLASHQPPQACRLHFVVVFCFASHIYFFICLFIYIY